MTFQAGPLVGSKHTFALHALYSACSVIAYILFTILSRWLFIKTKYHTSICNIDKDTVWLPLVIHPQNISLLQGLLHHKSLLLIRLLQLNYKVYASWAIRYSECSSRTILGDIIIHWVGEQYLLSMRMIAVQACPFGSPTWTPMVIIWLWLRLLPARHQILERRSCRLCARCLSCPSLFK